MFDIGSNTTFYKCIEDQKQQCQISFCQLLLAHTAILQALTRSPILMGSLKAGTRHSYNNWMLCFQLLYCQLWFLSPQHCLAIRKENSLRYEKEGSRQENSETDKSFGADEQCQLWLTRLELNRNKISIEMRKRKMGTGGSTAAEVIALRSLISLSAMMSAKIDQS